MKLYEDARQAVDAAGYGGGRDNNFWGVKPGPGAGRPHVRASVSQAATCTARNVARSKAVPVAPVGECSRPAT